MRTVTQETVTVGVSMSRSVDVAVIDVVCTDQITANGMYRSVGVAVVEMLCICRSVGVVIVDMVYTGPSTWPSSMCSGTASPRA